MGWALDYLLKAAARLSRTIIEEEMPEGFKMPEEHS